MIAGAGGEAVVSLDSVADWQSAHRIVECALDSFGGIDIVVINAGNNRFGPFWETTEEDYRAITAVHLDGSYFVSRAAAPHFREQASGAYVHMTSTGGLMGRTGKVHYCAAKAGIVGMSRAISLEMARFGVRSNCVAPFASSRMAGLESMSPERLAEIEKMRPEQNAQLVVALACPPAAHITGQVFISRGTEIAVAHQGFPAKTVHRSDGWSPGTILTHALPALGVAFAPHVTFGEYYTWPVI